MNAVLLDTDVCSYIFKGDTRSREYLPLLTGRRVFVCFVTVAEMYLWSIRRQWGQRQIEALNNNLASYGHLPYDDQVCWHWARAKSQPGHPMDDADAWIAAVALRHGLPLLTHNSRHFQHVHGLVLLSST